VEAIYPKRATSLPGEGHRIYVSGRSKPASKGRNESVQNQPL